MGRRGSPTALVGKEAGRPGREHGGTPNTHVACWGGGRSCRQRKNEARHSRPTETTAVPDPPQQEPEHVLQSEGSARPRLGSGISDAGQRELLGGAQQVGECLGGFPVCVGKQRLGGQL